MKLSETTQTLVALAVVAPNNRLLVVETQRGQLELPGLEIGEPGVMTRRLTQLLSKLGLDQLARQTLYLPALKIRKHQPTTVMGVIQLVRLAKAQPIEISGSRYETTKSLTEDETVSPVARAVARWLLQAQALPRHQ